MRTLNLYRLCLLISALCSCKLLTVQKEMGVDNGDTSDNWNKKWDLILKDPDSELLSNASTEDPNKLDELFSAKNESSKEIKNLKLSESELENFSKDEVFLAGTFQKRSGPGIENSFHLSQKEQSENLLNLSEEENFDFPKDVDEELSEDARDGNVKNKLNIESSKSNFEQNDSVMISNVQNLNNAAQQSDMENINSRSFIFNPNAKPQEQFQNCTTPKNETGSCRYLQHCLIPTIVSSLGQFMDYVCIIEGRFIGVCCPNLPVSVVIIQEQKEDTKNESELNENCGVSTNTRIVGGLNADPKAWPWMVALITKSKKRFFCGGALINDRYVLTAAHCTFGIANNEIIARVGEYDFKDNERSHEEYAVVEMKRHGHYNRRNLRNDIALLKLEKPVKFNEFVKTICFPEGENDYVGEKATLAGWGNLAGGGATSDVLQQASLPIISNEECSEGHGLPIPESLICTKSGDKGACNGDSGGPLMLLDKNNRWKAIGLVSWGRRGCNPEFPTVYTRVSYFLEWIEKHAR